MKYGSVTKIPIREIKLLRHNEILPNPRDIVTPIFSGM